MMTAYEAYLERPQNRKHLCYKKWNNWLHLHIQAGKFIIAQPYNSPLGTGCFVFMFLSFKIEQMLQKV